MINNFSKYKKYFTIFLVFVVSYYIANFSIRNLFLANSPRIRPNMGSYLIAKLNSRFESIRTLALSKLNFNLSPPHDTQTSDSDKKNITRDIVFEQLGKNLKPITKGVNAASQNGYNYYEFKVNEIEWVMIEYTLKNGETIKVRYPKGTNPPPREIYE